jgi:hypothetical protein
MEASGFVLTKSAARDAAVASWIDGPLTPDLESIPGIGKCAHCMRRRKREGKGREGVVCDYVTFGRLCPFSHWQKGI